MARTLKEDVETGIQVPIPAKHPVLNWLVEYCGILLQLFHRGTPHDGMTAYQRVRGRPWKVDLPCFGEQVEFRRRSPHKFMASWEPGCYLGVNIRTTERIVGNKDGIYVVQSVRRKAPHDRYGLHAEAR